MGRNYFRFSRDEEDDEKTVFIPDSDDERIKVEDELNGEGDVPAGWVTIEPAVLMFFVAYAMMTTMRTEYVSHRLKGETRDAEEYFIQIRSPWTDNCDRSINATESDIADLERAQEQASYWLLMYNALQILPAVFISPLIGAWSDQSGRKRAMLLPVIGYMIGTAIWVTVVYLNASKTWLSIAQFIIGIFGDFPTFVAVCNAYLCDIATLESRTYRMVVLGVIIEFATGVSQIVVGFLIFYYGFGPPFCFVLAVVILTGVYIIFGVKDYRSGSSETDGLFCVRQFDAVYELFANADSKKRIHIVSYLVVLGVHMMVLHSSFLLVLLYTLSYPLCWTSIVIGFYLACSLLLGSVGTLVAGKLFAQCVGDLTICQVGLWSGLIGLSLVAFGDSTSALFAAAILGSFRFMTSPAMRSRLSKLADKDEQGVMLASASCVESIGNLIGPSLFNLVYSLTLDSYRGTAFIIMAALYVPLAAIVSFFQWLDWEKRTPSVPRDSMTDHEAR